MTFYLAAQYARRDELREYARELRALGHEVSSRWLRERGDLSGDLTESAALYQERAERDLTDIDLAQTLVYFTEDPAVGIKRGGRHVEAGYALGRGKNLYIVGPRENIFCYSQHPRHFTDWKTFITWLKLQS